MAARRSRGSSGRSSSTRARPPALTAPRWARTGRRYVDRIRISGGTPPYRLTVKGLPAPLRVRGNGTIVGKPNAAGTYSLEVDVVDAAGIQTRATVALKIVRR